jgi:H+-transporting ATPase
MTDVVEPTARASAIGLKTEEARRRLAEVGPNATPDAEVHPLGRLLGKFIAPVPCLLEAAIVLQLFLGEYIEASIIGLLLVFNAALGVLHEGRAQATIEALKSRLALWASVRRDGMWRRIPATELVPGDVLKLSLDRVVRADARFVESDVLLDQSMLIGESRPIEAGAGHDGYAGALVQRG